MNSIHYWLTLNFAQGLGIAKKLELLSQFTTIELLFENLDQLNKKFVKLPEKTINALKNPDNQQIDRHLEWAEQKINSIISFDSPHFPALLKEISDPPLILFIHGDKAVLNQAQIAIVGSRNPSPTGTEITQEFAQDLSKSFVITSGLAQGVDTAAHNGALLGNGQSIAVVGTGLDRVYPSKNYGLAHKLVKNGALISEFPLGTPPAAANFPRRNRIISGLSLGTLVVEAALRSGSLITARLAAEQGREVFAIPGSIYNPMSKGCHKLIREGAKLVETAQDIIEELGPIYTSQIEINSNINCVSTNSYVHNSKQKEILKNLGYEPTPIDTVIERTGFTAETVSALLLRLELDGQICSQGGSYYKIEVKGTKNERKCI